MFFSHWTSTQMKSYFITNALIILRHKINYVICKNSPIGMKITQCHTITKSQRLTLFREEMAVGAESPTQIINKLCIIMYKFRMVRQVACTEIRVCIKCLEESIVSFLLSSLHDDTPPDTPPFVGLLLSSLHDDIPPDTPPFVGLLWANDQPVAETST